VNRLIHSANINIDLIDSLDVRTVDQNENWYKINMC
jgi:hypothetical protein